MSNILYDQSSKMDFTALRKTTLARDGKESMRNNPNEALVPVAAE